MQLQNSLSKEHYFKNEKNLWSNKYNIKVWPEWELNQSNKV